MSVLGGYDECKKCEELKAERDRLREIADAAITATRMLYGTKVWILAEPIDATLAALGEES